MLYQMRATRGYQNHKISLQGSAFHENREKEVSRDIMLFEVGFLSYSV